MLRTLPVNILDVRPKMVSHLTRISLRFVTSRHCVAAQSSWLGWSRHDASGGSLAAQTDAIAEQG